MTVKVFQIMLSYGLINEVLKYFLLMRGILLLRESESFDETISIGHATSVSEFGLDVCQMSFEAF